MLVTLHAGPRDGSLEELHRLRRFADDRDFHWRSVRTHLHTISALTDVSSPASAIATPPCSAKPRRAGAGAAWVIVALRAPSDRDRLALVVRDVMRAIN